MTVGATGGAAARRGVIALDVGDARIGVAAGELGSRFAFGRGAIERRGTRHDVPAVLEAAAREGAATVVVGLPLRLDGSESPQTQRVRAFAEALASTLASTSSGTPRSDMLAGLEALVQQDRPRDGRRPWWPTVVLATEVAAIALLIAHPRLTSPLALALVHAGVAGTPRTALAAGDAAVRRELVTPREIEVAAARAEEALRVQALIDARSQLEDRRLRLLRLISPSVNGHLDQPMEAVSGPRLELNPIEDLKDRLQLAEKSRPDLNEARLRLQQNRLETIYTRNGLLPRLDFFIALGKTGYADTFSAAFRELDGNTYDFTVGLRLSHILGNRAAHAKDVAAHASRQQAAAAIDNLKQLIRLEVRLGINEVERARQQIGATRETRIFQEQTLAAEKERFDVGTSTALEVAQAQRDLLQIQIAEVETIVNYRIALVKLYLAEGSLLDRRGVSIQR